MAERESMRSSRGGGSVSSKLDRLALLDCKVEAYERVNDGSVGEEHLFSIRVWCERTYTYEIVRSATELVRLSSGLAKRFPRADLGEVPIASCVRPRRQLALGGGVGVALSGRASWSAPKGAASFAERPSKTKRRASTGTKNGRGTTLVVSDSSDAASMSSYKASIEAWLRSLLVVPEVVGSDEVVSWLADDDLGEDDDLVTEVDFALEDEAVHKALVRHGSSVGITLRVPRGHFVVWSFASKPRDVAFSVECEGREARTYERVPSHERLFQGVWENAQPYQGGDAEGVDIDALLASSEVTVRWGNEYAKWRDKRVYYQVAVLSKDALDLARRRHRHKIEAEAERDAHREALERVAKQLSEQHVDDDDDDDRASTATTSGILPSADDEWRALPRRELEAAALAATAKAEALSAAMSRLEAEASAATRERDESLATASECRGRAEEAETRAAAAVAAAKKERAERLGATEDASAARAQVIEARDALDQVAARLEAAERQVEALRHERDLLAEAARGYRDSAELARGADLARGAARDDFESTALAAVPADIFATLDDDDDLLDRVDALQSRIDSELGRVVAHNNDNNNIQGLPPAAPKPPPPPPPPKRTPLLAASDPPPQQLRRHDLVVQPGFGAGDEMPFTRRRHGPLRRCPRRPPPRRHLHH